MLLKDAENELRLSAPSVTAAVEAIGDALALAAWSPLYGYLTFLCATRGPFAVPAVRCPARQRDQRHTTSLTMDLIAMRVCTV